MFAHTVAVRVSRSAGAGGEAIGRIIARSHGILAVRDQDDYTFQYMGMKAHIIGEGAQIGVIKIVESITPLVLPCAGEQSETPGHAERDYLVAKRRHVADGADQIRRAIVHRIELRLRAPEIRPEADSFIINRSAGRRRAFPGIRAVEIASRRTGGA
jgi:hypothetical protein